MNEDTEEEIRKACDSINDLIRIIKGIIRGLLYGSIIVVVLLILAALYGYSQDTPVSATNMVGEEQEYGLKCYMRLNEGDEMTYKYFDNYVDLESFINIQGHPFEMDVIQDCYVSLVTY